jgi:integrase
MSKRTWIKCKTPGVRYREHPTRKHGVRADRYFSIRYKLDGKDKEEGLGWSSEGMTESKAGVYLAELRKAARTGEGERTLAEKRQKAQAKRKAEESANLTFGDFWTQTYLPQALADKSRGSWVREEQLGRTWILPVLGEKPLRKLSPIHLERVKKNMADKGLSPRTVQYCLAVIRQAFNHARRLDLFSGDNPVSKVKKPSPDNRRMRFLTEGEAAMLLEACREESQQMHDQALLSLHCGLRAGEIFNLKWRDVDLENGILALRGTKSGKTRYAHMTEDVMTMLSRLDTKEPDALVFPGRKGEKQKEIGDSFERAVAKCGLNEGVADRRDRVVFHSLRHSFASWLVQAGVSLYVVKEALGHGTMAMTERYAHLAPDAMKGAVNVLNGKGQAKEAAPGKVVALRQN